MCTAITLKSYNRHTIFGRNYDFTLSGRLEPTLAPRGYQYLNGATHQLMRRKYAVLGISVSYEDILIFADGVNEAGLSCAILDLPGYASWNDQLVDGKENILSYDITFWILSNFSSIDELKKGLKDLNIAAPDSHKDAKDTQVHWMVTDKSGQSIVIEKTKNRFTVYNNKVGVLTNNPTFDWHLTNLNQYINIESQQPIEKQWGNQPLIPYSQGFGGIGLPGDFSSPSRFVKAAFLRNHAMVGQDDESALTECFRILSSVSMMRGAVKNVEKQIYFTRYTSVMNVEQLIYYYRTYENPQIVAIDMKKEDLDGKELKVFPYSTKLNVQYQN